MSHRAKRPLLLGMALIIVAGLTSAAAAQQPNLTYNYYLNWQYPIFPTAVYCPVPNVVPATLPGNSTIYLNDSGINNGNASALDFTNGNYIDGEIIIYHWIATLLPGEPWAGCGLQWSVRGGRHTFELVADVDDEVVESNENDNVWAHQFVLTPYVLSESTPKSRGVPPSKDGGVSSIVDGSLWSFNCDGFRFSNTGWWNVITMYAQDDADDYDLELFPPSTGSENGFLGAYLGSFDFEGYLEALIVNTNTVPVQDFDVGVTNYNAGTSQFVIEQVVSQPAYLGDSITVDLGADEYLRIWDTNVWDTGWITISVEDFSPGGEALYVGLIDKDATETTLPQISDYAITDESGKAWLHKDITTTGYYGLVVYRHPVDGGLAKTIQVKIEPTPPDLLPVLMPGWHAPLVPTPVPMTGFPVVLPNTLNGYIPETYFSYSLENYSPTQAPSTDMSVLLDGLTPPHFSTALPILGPFTAWADVNSTGVLIPGGRHTLTMDLDHDSLLHEIREDNNTWGEQYCWSPLEMMLGGQYSNPAPGPLLGGVTTIQPGMPVFFNCDGYRLYTGNGNWEGLVLTQGPNSDYDLSIHDALVGVKNGFDDYLATSYFLAGETDYVLFNNNLLPTGVYDIGVENFSGDEEYTIEAVGSTSLPVPVSGTHGPFGMGMGHMLHLFNIYLEQDLYAFRLDNLFGVVDWGITLHPHDTPMLGRHEIMDGGTAYMNGPGDPEWITVNIPVGGWYGLAVFKVGPLELGKDGEYQLRIMQGVTGVPDGRDLPVVTALAGIHPNPFNPQATILYDLAAAAAVELAIYDLKGARVRRLVSEPMSAGRHEAVWNGQDDAGARVASGVYLARFIAGDHREVRKVVMVK